VVPGAYFILICLPGTCIQCPVGKSQKLSSDNKIFTPVEFRPILLHLKQVATIFPARIMYLIVCQLDSLPSSLFRENFAS